LFGRIADKRTLIRGESSEPLSEILDHRARAAHDRGSRDDHEGSESPLPGETTESATSPLSAPIIRRPYSLDIPDNSEDKRIPETPEGTGEKSTIGT
jgi:hypothetical protein